MCLSPRAQLRRHHGDRCLHSPQFEQCPAVLGRTAHSFALFHVAGYPPHSALSFSLSPFSSSNAIPGIPRQNERYTNEKDASPFLFTIPAVTADGKKQECAYGNRRGPRKWWTNENRDETCRRAAEVYTIGSPPPPLSLSPDAS